MTVNDEILTIVVVAANITTATTTRTTCTKKESFVSYRCVIYKCVHTRITTTTSICQSQPTRLLYFLVRRSCPLSQILQFSLLLFVVCRSFGTEAAVQKWAVGE